LHGCLRSFLSAVSTRHPNGGYANRGDHTRLQIKVVFGLDRNLPLIRTAASTICHLLSFEFRYAWLGTNTQQQLKMPPRPRHLHYAPKGRVLGNLFSFLLYGLYTGDFVRGRATGGQKRKGGCTARLGALNGGFSRGPFPADGSRRLDRISPENVISCNDAIAANN
jgi:hypothetical protein